MNIIFKVLVIARHRYLTFALRLVLTGLLITAGTIKASQYDNLLAAIKEHEILPSLLEGWLAHALPWVEITLAVTLAAGLYIRIGAITTILLTVMLAVANGIAMIKGLDYGCSCFGDILRFSHGAALAIDLAMMAGAIQLLFHQGEFLSLDGWRNSRRATPAAEEQPQSGV